MKTNYQLIECLKANLAAHFSILIEGIKCRFYAISFMIIAVIAEKHVGTILPN